MVTTRDVEYEVDGTVMIGRLALPDGDGTRPAVLIAHEGPGLDDFQKERASRFAELGYVAFALDVKAVVGFHPGLGTQRPDDARNIVGKVLVCVGTEDPFIPVEQRLAFEAEMRAGGVDWRMNLYGLAEHSFTHPWTARVDFPGVKYHQSTDERSWRAMLDLFAEVFG